MHQLEFPLLARLTGPSVVHPYYINRCKTYREAVQTCWAMRRVHRMTRAQLAAEAGLRVQLVSDYLHPDNEPYRRDLPGDGISDFESVCGNTMVTQWLAAQSSLTVLEQLQVRAA